MFSKLRPSVDFSRNIGTVLGFISNNKNHKNYKFTP